MRQQLHVLGSRRITSLLQFLDDTDAGLAQLGNMVETVLLCPPVHLDHQMCQAFDQRTNARRAVFLRRLSRDHIGELLDDRGLSVDFPGVDLADCTAKFSLKLARVPRAGGLCPKRIGHIDDG